MGWSAFPTIGDIIKNQTRGIKILALWAKAGLRKETFCKGNALDIHYVCEGNMLGYNRRIKLILVAIFLGTMYWIIQSAFSAYLFHEGEFHQQVLAPSWIEIWHRLLVFGFMFGFAFHADYLVSRRESALAALRESEEKYRRLVELSPDAIAIQCKDRIVFVNSAGVKLFGADNIEQIMGKSVWDFVLAKNIELVKERYRQMREHGARSLPIEQTFLRLDGKHIDAEVLSVSFLYNGESAIMAIFRDMTDRKKERDELTKLKKAVDTSGEVIFLTDRDGIFTYVNPEFTRLYGYSEEEVVGKVTPRILKSGMLTVEDYEVFWNTILNKQVAKGTWINKDRAETVINIEGSANPVLDDNGEIVGFLALQHNVTERTQEEEKLQRRNRELNALYTIAATLNQAGNQDQILDQALGAILSLDWIGGGASGMIFLLDEQKCALNLAAHRGVPTGHPCLLKPPRIGECLCGLVIQQNNVMMSEDGWKDARHSRRWEGMDSHRDICLPIRARGRALGVMDLRLPAVQVVTPSDINLLKSMADQIGLAVENAHLAESKRKAIFSERERIARDLHDDMGQLLGYVNTKVAAVRLLLEGGQYRNAEKNLIHLEEAAQRLSVDVRKAILDLRASGSAQMGGDLASMIGNYIEQFNRLGVFTVTLDVGYGSGEFSIPPETGVQVLRIIQEAITNAMKHAGTTEIAVILKGRDDFIELNISDNGSGFELAGVEKSAYPHFGMNTMRERVEQLGGLFQVDTKPGAGTKVIVSIPIERRELQ
ncbi:MAG: PAS domain S-box protein [Chloroflexi bacterium]|nr:PAS domain S-box protein [Chloroflexota bacterium]